MGGHPPSNLPTSYQRPLAPPPPNSPPLPVKLSPRLPWEVLLVETSRELLRREDLEVLLPVRLDER